YTTLFRSTLLALPVPLFAADWPHWRGPSRTGITDEPPAVSGGIACRSPPDLLNSVPDGRQQFVRRGLPFKAVDQFSPRAPPFPPASPTGRVGTESPR